MAVAGGGRAAGTYARIAQILDSAGRTAAPAGAGRLATARPTISAPIIPLRMNSARAGYGHGSHPSGEGLEGPAGTGTFKG